MFYQCVYFSHFWWLPTAAVKKERCTSCELLPFDAMLQYFFQSSELLSWLITNVTIHICYCGLFTYLVSLISFCIILCDILCGIYSSMHHWCVHSLISSFPQSNALLCYTAMHCITLYDTTLLLLLHYIDYTILNFYALSTQHKRNY